MTAFRHVDAGRATLRVALAGEGPLVILVHGFPESWYSWRHQIGPIAEAGFRVAAIDVRGYGGSDKPREVEAYSLEALSGDVIGVAEALAPGGKAILIGHDWGAPIVWNAALTRPDRVAAVAGLAVPWVGVPRRAFDAVFEERFTRKGRFFYQAWFAQVGPPEAEAERDVRGFLRKFFYAISGDAPDGAWPAKAAGASLLDGMADPDPFPAWLNDADIDHYVGEFELSGFFGPLCRYRNHARDFMWQQTFADRAILQPALFIGGTRDPATTLFGMVPDPVAALRGALPGLRGATLLDGCGHWTQQERPVEVNALLLDWLKGLT